ncbi:MAG: cupin domain-containing protein, partial [Planctomycetota bacterium]|nr:cupin domain-containing protein [Planctomycetota bacterium]
MTKPSTARVIARLGLAPHPEGGHYRETFRSEARVQAAHGDRAAVTSILFLLEGGEESRSHKVLGDEIWLHHGGDDVDLVIDGRTVRLGAGEDAELQAFV